MVDRLEFALYANIICCKRISSYLWKSPTEIIFLDNLCNQLGLRFWIKQDLHQKKNNQIIYLNIFCRNSVQFSNPAWDHRNFHCNQPSEFIWKRPTEFVNPEPNGTLYWAKWDTPIARCQKTWTFFSKNRKIVNLYSIQSTTNTVTLLQFALHYLIIYHMISNNFRKFQNFQSHFHSPGFY